MQSITAWNSLAEILVGPTDILAPWHRTCLYSTGTTHTSGECSRTSVTAICIDWMCRAAKSADVNRPAQLHFYGPTVWNSLPSVLRDGSLSLSAFWRHGNCRLFEQSWTSPGAVVASCDSGVSHNLLTYLALIFLLFGPWPNCSPWFPCIYSQNCSVTLVALTVVLFYADFSPYFILSTFQLPSQPAQWRPDTRLIEWLVPTTSS